MATMKRQVYGDLERGLAPSTADADELMLASFSGGDFQEGVASFLERRDPRFAPLGQAAAEPQLAGDAGL
jgi:enoyl-CoA hydratase/carnithine racemase